MHALNPRTSNLRLWLGLGLGFILHE